MQRVEASTEFPDCGGASAPSEQSDANIRTGTCECGCGRKIPPATRYARIVRRFASDACRARVRNRRIEAQLRATQQALDFTPAPTTGEPYEACRVWLLGRLMQGPVRCLDLRVKPWPASANPGQRVLELRNRQHDVRTLRALGTNWYLLAIDGEPCWGEDSDSYALRQVFNAGDFRYRERG